MPKTYSVDLREKVMQFYKESKHKSKTCELFNIARTTLDDWILLEQQTGQLKQPKSPNMGRPSCILDLQAQSNSPPDIVHCPDHGHMLEIQYYKGGIPTVTPWQLALPLLSLPPILYMQYRIPVSS